MAFFYLGDGRKRRLLKNIDSIKNNAGFQRIYAGRHSVSDRNLVVYEGGGSGKIGIVCSKKVGNSVVRHHFARIIREIYRKHKVHLRKDKDIVVIARSAAKDQGFTETEASFVKLVKRLSVYEEQPSSTAGE